MENTKQQLKNKVDTIYRKMAKVPSALLAYSIFVFCFLLLTNSESLAQTPSKKNKNTTPSLNTSDTKPTNDPAPNATPEPAPEASDKIDVEGLEKKYWSAKDDDFTVVQNRNFTKSNKFYLSLMTGKIVNDGFIEGSPNSISLGYFFNEKNGINLDHTDYLVQDNSVTKQFLDKNGTKPAYNSILNTTSLRYFWSPIYAKVSLLEKKILYLDVALGVHIGQTGYKIMTEAGGEIKKASHYGFDISQLWFLNKNFAIRFDIRNTWTAQEQKTYRDQGSGASTSIGTTQFQDNAWLLGINYFFDKRK